MSAAPAALREDTRGIRVWIDVTNSPHVVVFRPLVALLTARGHEVTITARDFAQTVELLVDGKLEHTVVGPPHGGALDNEIDEWHAAYTALVLAPRVLVEGARRARPQCDAHRVLEGARAPAGGEEGRGGLPRRAHAAVILELMSGRYRSSQRAATRLP